MRSREFTQSWAHYLIWVVIVYGTRICYVNSLLYPATTSRRSLGSVWWRGAAKRVGLLWYWKWKWMNVGLIREESCGCVSPSDTVELYTCAPRTDTDTRAPLSRTQAHHQLTSFDIISEVRATFIDAIIIFQVKLTYSFVVSGFYWQSPDIIYMLNNRLFHQKVLTFRSEIMLLALLQNHIFIDKLYK